MQHWLALVVTLLLLAGFAPADYARPQTASRESTRAAAERAYAEGEGLRAERTESSLKRAINRFEEALELSRAAADRKREALSLAGLGAAHLALADESKALGCYGQSLAIFQALGESGWDAILNNPDMLYSSMGGQAKVLAMLTEALPLVRGLRNPGLEGILVGGIARVQLDAGEPRKARELYQQALTLRKAAGDRYGQALALHRLCQACETAGD